MGLSFDIESEFFEESKLSCEIEFASGVALDGSVGFIEKRALHLGIATAINFINVIHLCNYNE